MSSQNLVSASVTPETKTEIIKKITEIKNSLNFLITLQPDQISSLFKSANGYAPFVELAYNTSKDHPDILPPVFDAAEFHKDYLLSKDLGIIADGINQLNDSINTTLLAAKSDAIANALDVYAAVKQNRDRVPGLNVVADEMGEFFKKAKKKTS